MAIEQNKSNNENPKQHRLLKLLLSTVALVSWLAYRRMPQEQRDKFNQVLASRFHTATHAIVDYIIPHERNGYQPKVFQARSVKHILLVVVVVKIALISTLFVLYPNLGRLEQDMRSQMYALINQYRIERGTHQLSINAYLEQAATAKGNDMIAQNYFSHFGPDGKKPWQWLDPAQYDFKAMGENLGMDYLTAASVFKAFQKSPTHDKNLINPGYNEIGIATLNGTLDGHSTNVMVVFFGTRKEAPTKVAVAPATAPVVTTPVKPAQAPVSNPTPAQPKEVAPTPKPTPVVTQPAPEPVAIEPVQNEPAVTPEQSLSDRVVAAQLNPQIEVLGEAVSNEQGHIVGNFERGVIFSQGTWLQRLIAWSNRFLFAFLLALIALFAVNIVVKFRVQHAHIILNSVVLIIVVAGALYLHIHTAEAIGENIRILGAALNIW